MQAKKQDIKKAYKESSCEETKDTLKRLYPELEFEKKLADSWEEYVQMTGCNFHCISFSARRGYIYDTNFGSEDSKHTAFHKLELLRDHYNDGVNYYKKIDIVSIVKRAGLIKIDSVPTSDQFLTFKDKETAEKFFLNFKYLIEQAEDLI